MTYIFVHGLGQDASAWAKTIDGMRFNTEVVCPEIFGLCKTEKTYDNLYKAFCLYCDSFHTTLNICGLSLGGTLALNYAIDHPEKINSLILIATQYRIPKILMRLQNMFFTLLPNQSFKKLGLGKNEVIALTNSMMHLNFQDELKRISCPTLIICGDKDRVNLKASKELEQLMDCAQLRIIKRAGHEINRENPIDLSRELIDFYSLNGVKK